jgi:hypothetical protein
MSNNITVESGERTVVIGCKVLDYDSLDEGVKESLLAQEWEAVVGLYESDVIEDRFAEHLATAGFTGVEWTYCYQNSQNDGAVFDASIDVEKACKHFGIEYDPQWNGCLLIEGNGSDSFHKRSRKTVLVYGVDFDIDKIPQLVKGE